MGAFFTNVHVSVPNTPPPAAIQVLRQRISKRMLKGPYRLAGPGDVPDRTVVIVPDRASGWYVILDEDSDSMDPKVLEDLAAPLSYHPVAASITVAVADSDSFELVLYRDGARADSVSVGSRRHRSLNREAWAPLLSSRHLDEVNASLRADSAFAEDCLATIARVFGWHEEIAFLGFSHVSELPAGSREELRFCLRSDANLVRYRAGPALLRSGQTEMSVSLTAGQSLHGFFGTIYNEGGPGKGLAVLIPFPEATGALLQIQSLHLAVGEDLVLDTAFQRVPVPGGVGLRVQLPDLPLPGWPEWTGPESSFNALRMNRFLQRGRLWPSLVGTALKAGRTDLTVHFVPLSNPQGGTETFVYHVVISPAP